jgi:hypothetical protein
VLRDSLSRQPELMLHGQTITQLEKSLAVALNQLVQNRTTRWSSDCLEDVAHIGIIGK